MDKVAGRHLILDAELSEESLEITASREKMAEYLEKITEVTGMTLVFPPISAKFPFASETHRLIDNLNKEGTTSPVIETFKSHLHNRDTIGSGVSAMSMWLESHCTLHSWTEDKYISIDLFSCKLYEIEPVIRFTADFMKLKDAHILVVDRNTRSRADVLNLDLKTYLERSNALEIA